MKLFLLFAGFNPFAAGSDLCPRSCICTEQGDDGTYVDCRGKGLKYIPEDFPENTHVIDLSNNYLTMLDELPILEELVLLNLTNNQIEDIDVNALIDLDELKTLILSHNRIRWIEDDVFEWGPDELRHIYLDHNRLETIEHYLFTNLERLEEIDLSNNRIYQVDNHAFDDLSSLHTLRLHGNQLKTFKPHWIYDALFHGIQELTFHDNPWSCDCGMDKAFDDLIEDSSKSTIFKSALGNAESSLICQAPLELKERSVLSLSKSEIDNSCEKPIIKEITDNFEIEKGKPLIIQCHAEGFPPPLIEWRAPNGDIYTALNDDYDHVIVHLDGTLLITDGADTLDDGTYYCVAKSKSGMVESQVNVSVVGVNNRDIPRHPDLCPYDPVGRRFQQDGDNCTMGNIEHMVAAAENSWNEKDEIEENCPQKCTCDHSTAFCSNQQQMYLPTSLPAHVTTLEFQNNYLDALDRDLCGNFIYIGSIMLDENQIRNVDTEAFKACKNLKKLTLSSNLIKDIAPAQFDDLNKLEILDLSKNDISYLPSNAFTGLDSLKKLYLKDNIISSIDMYAFKNLMNIEYLYLEGNAIYHIKHDWLQVATMAQNRNLTGIFLGENMIECDCNLKEFKDDFLNKDSRIFKILKPDEILCSYPRSLQGQRLTSLDLDALSCVNELFPPLGAQHEKGHGYSAVTFFMGILITAGGYYLYQKYKRFRITQAFPSMREQRANADDSFTPLVSAAQQEAFA